MTGRTERQRAHYPARINFGITNELRAALETLADNWQDGAPVPRGPGQRLPICTVLNNHHGSGAVHRSCRSFLLAVKNGFLICHIVTGL